MDNTMLLELYESNRKIRSWLGVLDEQPTDMPMIDPMCKTTELVIKVSNRLITQLEKEDLNNSVVV